MTTQDNFKADETIIRSVSGDQLIMLGSLDGHRLICDAQDLFVFIDSGFINWGMNKSGVATPRTPVRVDETVKSGTFVDIFQALPGAWNDKWFSQNQIITFCETFPEWLRKQGYDTFFLVKKDERQPIDGNNLSSNLAIVRIEIRRIDERWRGNYAYVSDFGFDGIWNGDDHFRIISPKVSVFSAVASTTTIPATNSKFRALEKFAVNISRDAKVKIFYISESFRVWFEHKEEDNFCGSIVYGRDPIRISAESTILDELGGPEKAVTTLTEIFFMMGLQPNGEKGALLNNGGVNVFYPEDINNKSRTVSVSWSGIGWSMDSYSGMSPEHYNANRRIFSRNPGVSLTV